MDEELVRRFEEQFGKMDAQVAEFVNDGETKANFREAEIQANFEKILGGRKRMAELDVALMQAEKELKCRTEVKENFAAAHQMILSAECRENAAVDELEKNTSTLNGKIIDKHSQEEFMDNYKDMVEKLAEMHTVSRRSQNLSLVSERRRLDEQVANASARNAGLRRNVEELNKALDATGYEGVLHDTKQSLMSSIKASYLAMKNEVVRLRIAAHTLRIRLRTSQPNSTLTK
ncbi:hypothetical protein Q1695_012854 [Nippostrongylus brasiliensis]|nr:hypothetical protein Q1695_012854 [Nippostrongylus brasiliensis]